MSQQQKQIRDAIILTSHLFFLLVVHLLLLVICLLLLVPYLLLLLPYLLLLLVEYAVMVGNFGPPYIRDTGAVCFVGLARSTLGKATENKYNIWMFLKVAMPPHLMTPEATR